MPILRNFTRIICHKMWLNKAKGTNCQKTGFEFWGCKVKISQNMVPKSSLRFQYLKSLIFKLLAGFGATTVFSCKNRPLNCQNTNTLNRFPNFFSKSTYHQLICYDILHKIAISQERNVRFWTSCTKFELK